MFKLSSDVLANFRGVQSALRELLDKIADIYRRLRSVEERIDGIPLGSSSSGITLPIDATDVNYDNSTSGLTATDVQDAIDELAASSGTQSPLTLDIGYASSDITTTMSADLLTATCLGSSSGSIPSSYPIGGSGGKLYWEVECIAIPAGAGSKLAFGVETRISLLNSNRSGAYPGSLVGSWGYWNSGSYYNNSGSSGTPATLASGDIGQVALDQATGKLWFGKNNTWQSGGNPAAGTSPVFTSSTRLNHQVHAVVCPYVAGAVIRLRRVSENSYSPPSGFSAAFD